MDILAVGRARILVPAGEAWDSWFEGNDVTADFMDHRDPPGDQIREPL